MAIFPLDPLGMTLLVFQCFCYFVRAFTSHISLNIFLSLTDFFRLFSCFTEYLQFYLVKPILSFYYNSSHYV